MFSILIIFQIKLYQLGVLGNSQQLLGQQIGSEQTDELRTIYQQEYQTQTQSNLILSHLAEEVLIFNYWKGNQQIENINQEENYNQEKVFTNSNLRSLQHPCESLTLTPSTIPDQSYQLFSGTVQYVFNEWTDNVGTCNPYTYTAKLADGNNLPSFITFEPTQRRFTYDSSSSSDRNTYSIIVYGQSTAFSSSQVGSEQFILIVVCNLNAFTDQKGANVDYYNGQGYLIIPLKQTFVQDPDCGFDFSCTIEYVKGPNVQPLPSWASVNEAGCSLTMDSNDPANEANYSFLVTATLIDDQGNSITASYDKWRVKILAPLLVCSTETFTATVVPNQVYHLSATTLAFTFNDWTYVSGLCGGFTYEVEMADGSAAPGFISIDSVTRTLSVFSNDYLNRGIHNLRIKGYLTNFAGGTIDFSATFSVEIICVVSSINVVDISTLTYNVGDPTVTQTIPAYTQTPNCNAVITYSATFLSGSPLVTPITFTTPNIFQVFTNSMTDLYTYTVEITASLTDDQSTKTQTANWQVIISTLCYSMTISPSIVPDQEYILYSTPPLQFSFAQWTENVGNCQGFSYDKELSTGGATPSFISLDSSTRTFSVSSSNFADRGTYNLVVKGQSILFGNQATSSPFTLVIKCQVDSLTQDSALTNITYTIGSATMTADIPGFTQTPNCGLSTVFSVQMSDGSSWPSFINFDSISNRFSVSTSDTSLVGDYIVKISGVLTHDTGTININDIYWKVTLVKECSAMVITTSTVADQEYQIFSTTDLQFSFLDWTEDVLTCGDFVYTHKLSSGVVAPSFITLDSPTKTFTVSSINPTDRGTYLLRVHGKTDSSATNPEATSNIFTLVMKCTVNTISTTGTISDLDYYVNAANETATIPVHYQDPACDFPITYTATLQDGNPLPSFITFDSIDSFSIGTTDFAHLGTNKVKISGSLVDDTGVTKTITDIIWTVNILRACPDQTITTTIVADQVYEIFTSPIQFTFDQWSEDTLGACGNFVYSHKLSTGLSPPSFITLDSPTRTFTITSNDPADRGTHLLRVHGQTDSSISNPEGISDIFQVTLKCTVNTISTTGSINDIDYYVNAVNQSASIPIHDQSPACNFPLTYTATLADGNPLPSFITFDGTDSFNIGTNDFAHLGTYNVTISGSLIDDTGSTKIISDIAWTVNILRACADQTITPSTIPDQVYEIFTLTPLEFVFTQWSEDTLGACGSFSYSHELLNGGPSPYFVTLTQGNQSFSVFSTDPNDRGTYDIVVKGKTSDVSSPEGTSAPFKLTMQCNVATIITSNMANATYLIEATTQTHPISSFTQSPSCQFPYTYVAKLTDGTDLPSYISFDGSSQFSVQTSDLTHAGLYEIVVTATLTDDTQTHTQQFTWFLEIAKDCNLMIITPTTVPNQVYNLFSPNPLTFTFNDWTNNMGVCGGFNYGHKLSDGTSPPSFISLDSATRQFSIQSSDISHRGTYNLKVHGQSINYPAEQGESPVFTVEVQCVTSVVSSGDMSDTTYYINFPEQTHSMTAFSQSPNCQFSQTYDAKLDSGLSLPGFIKFDSSTGIFTIEQTSNYGYIGIYNITVTATVTDDSGDKTGSFNWIVTVLKHCSDMVLTATSISHQVYVLGDPMKNITFNEFSTDISGCGTLSYWLTLSNGNPLPSLVYLDTPRNVIIESSEPTHQGYHIVRINGQVDSYPSITTFSTFQIQVLCYLNIFQSNGDLSPTTYRVGNDRIFQGVGSFTQNPQCGFPITYTATMDDNTPLKAFIGFDGSQFQIFTDDSSKTGLYNIKIKAQVTDDQQTLEAFQNWKLIVQPSINQNIGIPFFSTQLEKIYLVPTQHRVHQLPPVELIEVEEYSTKIDFQDTTFARYSNGKFFFYPQLEDIGDHYIIVTLENKQAPLLYNKYILQIEVSPLTNSNDPALIPQSKQLKTKAFSN